MSRKWHLLASRKHDASDSAAPLRVPQKRSAVEQADLTMHRSQLWHRGESRDESSRRERPHSRQVQKVVGEIVVRIADYRVVRALAGCGRHCATLFTQRANGFNRCKTGSLGDFDLLVRPSSCAFQCSGMAISLPAGSPGRFARTLLVRRARTRNRPSLDE